MIRSFRDAVVQAVRLDFRRSPDVRAERRCACLLSVEVTMRCEEMMKQDVACIAPDGTVEEAARQMRDANVGFLPVCGRDKKVLGTLTDRDIAIRVVAAGRPPSTKVSDAMTRDLVACRPVDDLDRVVELMSRDQKSRTVVVDEDDRLIGVVSLSDVSQIELDAGGRALRDITERETRA